MKQSRLMVDIVSNVPIREKRQAAKRYPFSSMKVGDSFFVENVVGESSKTTQRRLASACYAIAARSLPGRRFETRQEPASGPLGAGVRVWRVR